MSIITDIKRKTILNLEVWRSVSLNAYFWRGISSKNQFVDPVSRGRKSVPSWEDRKWNSILWPGGLGRKKHQDKDEKFGNSKLVNKISWLFTG